MPDDKDFTPYRNEPRQTLGHPGQPVRPSNALLMEGENYVERYSGGHDIMSKMAVATQAVVARLKAKLAADDIWLRCHCELQGSIAEGLLPGAALEKVALDTSKHIKETVTIEGRPAAVAGIVAALEMAARLGFQGSSRTLRVDVDGDGAFFIRLKRKDSELPDADELLTQLSSDPTGDTGKDITIDTDSGLKSETKTAGEEREPEIDKHESAPRDKMRPRSEIILYSKDGVFCIDKGDYILFPGGGVDDGEQPRDSAIRETIEESNRHPINVEGAAVIESVWPEDSGNEFWDNSEFDGERTYFFLGLDQGEAGITHDDLENFEVKPFEQVLSRLKELRDDESQLWAQRNNEVRFDLITQAKRLVRTKSGTVPKKLAAAMPSPTEQVGIPRDRSQQFVEEVAAKAQGTVPPPTPGQVSPPPTPAGQIAPPAVEEPFPAQSAGAMGKVADVAKFLPRKQAVMFLPGGRVLVRKRQHRRFDLPEETSARAAPYEPSIQFTPGAGVPEPGYHGYDVATHTGETEEIPEGFEAMGASDVLRELYASMGLSANRPYRQIDRARARVIQRFLKRHKREEEESRPVPPPAVGPVEGAPQFATYEGLQQPPVV